MRKRKMKCGDLIAPTENPFGFDELGLIVKMKNLDDQEFYVILWQDGSIGMGEDELVKGSYYVV